jgi:hypothetical protein
MGKRNPVINEITLRRSAFSSILPTRGSFFNRLSRANRDLIWPLLCAPSWKRFGQSYSFAGAFPKSGCADQPADHVDNQSFTDQNEPSQKRALLARGTNHFQIGHFHKKVFFRLPNRSSIVLFVVCRNCAGHGYPMVHVLYQTDGRTAQPVNLAILGFYRVLIRLIALSQASGHRGCVRRVDLPPSEARHR